MTTQENKPHMKREVAIEFTVPSQKIIYLYATVDAASTISQFGAMEKGAHPNEYRLTVDPRYDMGELQAWIETTYPLRG